MALHPRVSPKLIITISIVADRRSYNYAIPVV